MAVCEAYAQRSMCDDLGQREIGCFDVKIALDDL
jgi:hypothetical protein